MVSLKKPPSFLISILGVTACGCSPTTSRSSASAASEEVSASRGTCDEQVEQVKPTPTGELRQRYLWSCLIEHDFDSFVWERQWCSNDKDCTVVRTDCPFGCVVAV